MKVGDLCTCIWSKELLVYLGEGGYVGIHDAVSLATGERHRFRRDMLHAVKKCP